MGGGGRFGRLVGYNRWVTENGGFAAKVLADGHRLARTMNERWQKMRLVKMAWLLNHAPERIRWRFRKKSAATDAQRATRLQLVSPRGVVWDFKLNGGAWIKKADERL